MPPTKTQAFLRWLAPVGFGLLAGGLARWAMFAAGLDESIGDGVGALVTLAVVEGLRRRRHGGNSEFQLGEGSPLRHKAEDRSDRLEQ